MSRPPLPLALADLDRLRLLRPVPALRARIAAACLLLPFATAACHDPSPPPARASGDAVNAASAPHPSAAAGSASPGSGATTPELPTANGERPPRPDEAPSPSRACKANSDCALVPDDCMNCPPCEPTWRHAANKSTVQRMLAARTECPPIDCVQCTPPIPGTLTGYVGDRAVCEAGQCVVQ